MRRNVTMIAFLLVLLLGAAATVGVLAQQRGGDDDRSDEELVPGEAELRAVAPSPLALGADLGNACVCLCRAAATASTPIIDEWAYFERSLVSGCDWTGRLCVTRGRLGRVGACVAAPAHFQ